jgi:hypothetical protein
MSEPVNELTPLHKSVVVAVDQATAFTIFTTHFSDWLFLAPPPAGPRRRPQRRRWACHHGRGQRIGLPLSSGRRSWRR